jgi:hypothetical protein
MLMINKQKRLALCHQTFVLGSFFAPGCLDIYPSILKKDCSLTPWTDCEARRLSLLRSPKPSLEAAGRGQHTLTQPGASPWGEKFLCKDV